MNGETLYIETNSNVRAHIANSGIVRDHNLILIQVLTTTNDDLSYAQDNLGDVGLAIKYDINNVLYLMFSRANENLYWSFKKNNAYSGWNTIIYRID